VADNETYPAIGQLPTERGQLHQPAQWLHPAGIGTSGRVADTSASEGLPDVERDVRRRSGEDERIGTRLNDDATSVDQPGQRLDRQIVDL